MIKQFIVPEELAGKRLDIAVTEMGGISRSQVQKLIRAGAIRLDGATVDAKQAAKVGDTIELNLADDGPALPAPEIPILYEDADVLVVDKPAGLVVHLTESRRPQPTVAAFAAAHGVVDEDAERPGIVHRLDKDTSGAMVIAKNPAAKAELQRQFKQRTIGKTYVALVRGRLSEAEAIIRLPIGRHHRLPVKRAVLPGGREAVTRYRTLEVLPGATLVEINLQTGRTHQIRVHFSHIGHPVIGDVVYGDAKRPPGLARQFLHAAKLEFIAPSGKPVTVESPLPPDLDAFLRSLKP